jgi:hypothetical protein
MVPSPSEGRRGGRGRRTKEGRKAVRRKEAESKQWLKKADKKKYPRALPMVASGSSLGSAFQVVQL